MPSRFNFFNLAQLGGKRRGIAWISGHLAAAAMAVAALASPALAAPPPAGSKIINVATVEFTADGMKFTIPSNEVSVTINKVAGVSITSNQTKRAVPGNPVSFTHMIKNTGNAPDEFTLTVPSPLGAGLSNPRIYRANCSDGLAVNTIAITKTDPLNAGDFFCIVVEVSVDATVVPPQTTTFDIVATSTNDAGNNTPTPQTSKNTDTINVTNEAVFVFNKEIVMGDDRDGSNSFTPGDIVIVRLHYKNIGLSEATDVEIDDSLPSDLIYESNSGGWSDVSGRALSDNGGTLTNGNQDTLTYNAANNRVTAKLTRLPRNRSAFVDFKAKIGPNAAGSITNKATIRATNIPPEEGSSTIIIDDKSAIDLVLADSAPNPALPHARDLPDDDLVPPNGFASPSPSDEGPDKANDIILRTTAIGAGDTVPVIVVLHNLSATSQKFNLTSQLNAGPQRTDPTTPMPNGTQIIFSTEAGAILPDWPDPIGWSGFNLSS